MSDPDLRVKIAISCVTLDEADFIINNFIAPLQAEIERVRQLSEERTRQRDRAMTEAEDCMMALAEAADRASAAEALLREAGDAINGLGHIIDMEENWLPCGCFPDPDGISDVIIKMRSLLARIKERGDA